MTALDILARTRDLLPTPAQWTQGAMARDAEGKPVRPDAPAAACWSLFGALLCASSSDSDDDYERARAALSDGCTAAGGGASLPTFNDRPGRTHAQVLGAIDAAIESLKGKP